MKAIYKREVASYFKTMTGYVFAAVLIAFTGLYFMAINMSQGYPYFSVTLSNSMLIYILLIPVLTMRSFAEERRNKTDQLLLTSPVKLGDIVLGKYFAMLTVLAIPVMFLCICPLIIKIFGTAYLKADYAMLLCYFIVGAMFISVGMFISSLTENQIIAAVCTLAGLLLIYIFDDLLGYIPAASAANFIILMVIILLGALLLYLSTRNAPLALGASAAAVAAELVVYIIKKELFDSLITNLLSDFTVRGVIQNFASYDLFDLGGLLKLVAVTALFIFLTAQSVQKRRWN